ncbi:unnamed protein product, partial [Ectocarpus sp. 12 AP-2014]
GVFSGIDYDTRNMDVAAMSEGTANCLRGGPNPESTAQLLSAAGWVDAGTETGSAGAMRVFTKNNVRGLILPQGHCSFRSEFANLEPSDTAIRNLVNSLYPGSIRNGAPDGTTGRCDGFTLPRPDAWVHYTSPAGGTCRDFGTGVTIQFL